MNIAMDYMNVRLLFSTFSELLDNHEVFLC